MNEASLREWVRGTLDPVRRREVTLWMLRCPDPRVPDLLSALVREAEEERADHHLGASTALGQVLVDAWRALLAKGAAAWTTGLAHAPLAVLAAGVGDPGEALTLVAEAPGRVRVRVELDAGCHFAVFVSDDSGALPRLLVADHRGAGRWDDLPSWALDAGDARVTFWLFTALQPLPSTLPAAVAAEAAGLARGWAKRLEGEV